MSSDSLLSFTGRRWFAGLFCALLIGATTVARAADDDEKISASTRVPEIPAPAPVAQSPLPERQADVLMAKREYVAAIHLYETIEAPPAPLLNKIGIAYEKMRLYEQAKVNFEKALVASPKFKGPENNLGTVYYAQGDYRRAEQHYKKALKAEPRNASIYNNLGTLYFTRRKIHKGVEAYQQALSLDPEIFQRNAANSIQTEGSRESRALINFYLAETCAQAGMNGAAIMYLQRAIDAGFHDQTKLREDGRFAVLRETPEFKDLLLNLQHAETAAVRPIP